MPELRSIYWNLLDNSSGQALTKEEPSPALLDPEPRVPSAGYLDGVAAVEPGKELGVSATYRGSFTWRVPTKRRILANSVAAN